MIWDEGAALKVAALAHHGQVDKADHEYLAHPLRVASLVQHNRVAYGLVHDDEVEAAVQVAILHDVLEDSPFTPDMLEQLGCPRAIITRVGLLSRNLNSRRDYYPQIAGDKIARAVKAADIDDNLDPGRLAALDEKTQARLRKKYAKAKEELGL